MKAARRRMVKSLIDQGPRSNFLSGGAKDERVSQIGVGRGECMTILIPLNYRKCLKQTKLFISNCSVLLQSDL